MKFLITGTVRSNQGPRKIILFTYVLFFLFIISNFYLNITRISFDYNEFIQLLAPVRQRQNITWHCLPYRRNPAVCAA
jgi:hypothetical protein